MWKYSLNSWPQARHDWQNRGINTFSVFSFLFEILTHYRKWWNRLTRPPKWAFTWITNFSSRNFTKKYSKSILFWSFIWPQGTVQKYYFSSKNFIFHQTFHFRQKFYLSSKILFVVKNFICRQKFYLSSKILLAMWNFIFRQK